MAQKRKLKTEDSSDKGIIEINDKINAGLNSNLIRKSNEVLLEFKKEENLLNPSNKKIKTLHQNPKFNPHTYQNEAAEYSSTFKRILDNRFPVLKYRPRRPDEDRSTVHFGQRKLHLSEIEFLTNICKEISEINKKITLIYAGAAPGTHISKLSSMFPFIDFVLVDPAEFIVKPTERIKIIQDYFTDSMAKQMLSEYKNNLRLFISDIRVSGPGTLRSFVFNFLN
jgi:cap2 methyltransferase